MIHLLTAAASFVSLILVAIVACDTPCPPSAFELCSTVALSACLGALIARSLAAARS